MHRLCQAELQAADRARQLKASRHSESRRPRRSAQVLGATAIVWLLLYIADHRQLGHHSRHAGSSRDHCFLFDATGVRHPLAAWFHDVDADGAHNGRPSWQPSTPVATALGTQLCGRAGARQVHGKAARTQLRAFWPLVAATARETFLQFSRAPLAYMTIPMIAACVGYGTNWVGVKMIFYPIGFWGLPIKRWPESPLGFIGWQGIVPTKVKKMSARLVDVVTRKLLSMPEAFSRLNAAQLAVLLEPTVIESIEKQVPDGRTYTRTLRPLLRGILIEIVRSMQRDITEVLDLGEVVSSAFLRDKVLLGELFQQAGKKELEFLVNSGLGFGFFLGIFQMLLWIALPNGWVLPVGGALVGYVTNWVAIKLIFEPVEPTPVGPLVLQGLFEKRQKEVSEIFADFLAQRVLTSQRLIDEMASGRLQENFRQLVRKQVPALVPDTVVDAAVAGFQSLSQEPSTHPVHAYVDEKLGLRDTLNERLQSLSCAEFENLLHPVFQEDELTLIIAGGVLGFAAGLAQQAGGWGGPRTVGAFAMAKAALGGTTIGAVTAASRKAFLLPWVLLRRLPRWRRRRQEPRAMPVMTAPAVA